MPSILHRARRAARVAERTFVPFALALAAAPAAPLGAQGTETLCGSPAAATDAATADAPLVVPIDVSNAHVFVKVCTGDRVLDFILDTGAPTSIFDLGTARSMGLKLGRAFTAQGVGAATVAGASLERTTVTLAGTDVRHPVASAIDFSGIPPREGHRLDGILGHDFIERFVVAIDYAKREMRLHERDGFRYEGSGASIPLRFVGNYPHVDAELRLDDGATLRGRFLLDVGASQSVSLAKPWVDEHRLRQRAGPTVRQRGGSGVGGATSYDVGRVAALRLGDLELARPTVVLHGDSAGIMSRSGPSVGSIGGEVLRRFTVYLAYRDRRMILEPHAGTAEPFEADMSGLAMRLDDHLSAIVVDAVAPDTPAAGAGVAAGDTVVAVDGLPVTIATLDALRTRLRRDGERVELTIRRAGETRVLTLVARRLV